MMQMPRPKKKPQAEPEIEDSTMQTQDLEHADDIEPVPEPEPDPPEPDMQPPPFEPITSEAALPPLPPLGSFSSGGAAIGGAFGRVDNQPQHPVSRPARRTASLSVYTSLESLYAAVRELDTDQGRLRVERVEPEWVQGPAGRRIPVAGIIAYLQDCPTTQQFAQQFGGRKYRVYAEVLIEDKQRGDGPRYMDVAVAEVKFPLDPNLDELPIVGEEQAPQMDVMGAAAAFAGAEDDTPYSRFDRMNRNRQFFIGTPPATQQPNSSREVLEAMREGVNIARGASAREGNPFDLISGLTNQQMESLKEVAERQERMHERELSRRDAELAEIRREMREAQNRPTNETQLLGGVGQLISALKRTSSEEEASSIMASHERELTRLKDDHRRELESIRRERDRDVDSMRTQMESERNRFTEKERDLRRDFERQEQMLREEMDRRERSVRQDAEREIRTLSDGHRREIDALKSAFEDKVRMTEMFGQTTVSTTVSAKDTTIENLREKVATLTAEANAVKAEAADLRAKINRSVPEVLQEARGLAAMTGMKDPSEIEPTAGTDESKDKWDRVLDTLANKAGENLPAILGTLGNVAVGAAHAVTGRQMQMPAQRAQVVMEQQVQEGPTQFGPDGSVMRPPKQIAGGQQRPRRQAQPAQQQQQEPAVPQGPAVHAQPEQPAPPQQAAPAVDPWAGFEWSGLDADTLTGIANVLLGTMQEGAPASLAAERLGMVFGSDMMVVVAKSVDADKVVASLHKAPATRSTMLATSAGRKFVRETWAAMEAMATEPEPEAAA
jgi:hypothetical protein